MSWRTTCQDSLYSVYNSYIMLLLAGWVYLFLSTHDYNLNYNYLLVLLDVLLIITTPLVSYILFYYFYNISYMQSASGSGKLLFSTLCKNAVFWVYECYIMLLMAGWIYALVAFHNIASISVTLTVAACFAFITPLVSCLFIYCFCMIAHSNAISSEDFQFCPASSKKSRMLRLDSIKIRN